jgi:hypothetical protein
LHCMAVFLISASKIVVEQIKWTIISDSSQMQSDVNCDFPYAIL